MKIRKFSFARNSDWWCRVIQLWGVETRRIKNFFSQFPSFVRYRQDCQLGFISIINREQLLQVAWIIALIKFVELFAIEACCTLPPVLPVFAPAFTRHGVLHLRLSVMHKRDARHLIADVCNGSCLFWKHCTLGNPFIGEMGCASNVTCILQCVTSYYRRVDRLINSARRAKCPCQVTGSRAMVAPPPPQPLCCMYVPLTAVFECIVALLTWTVAIQSRRMRSAWGMFTGPPFAAFRIAMLPAGYRWALAWNGSGRFSWRKPPIRVLFSSCAFLMRSY